MRRAGPPKSHRPNSSLSTSTDFYTHANPSTFDGPDNSENAPFLASHGSRSSFEHTTVPVYPPRQYYRPPSPPPQRAAFYPEDSSHSKRRRIGFLISGFLLLLLGITLYQLDSPVSLKDKIDPEGTKVKAVGDAWAGMIGKVHDWWKGDGDEGDEWEEAWNATAPHYISALPKMEDRKPDVGEKFIGFLPHSGFHNQRIALENAFGIAAATNRTLLVPPIWLGWPNHWTTYKQLQADWDTQLEDSNASFLARDPSSPYPIPAALPSGDSIPSAEECKSFAHECRDTYRNTFVAWDYMSDLEKAADAAGTKVFGRWNVSVDATKETLDIQSDDEVMIIEDTGAGHKDPVFLFQNDTEQAQLIEPIDRESNHLYTQSVSLPLLAVQPQKLVLFGSLFGSMRLRLSLPPTTASWTVHHSPPGLLSVARSLVFDSPLLNPAADEVAKLLGGDEWSYVGVHLRIGDGYFINRAARSARLVWEDVVDVMGVDRQEAKALLDEETRKADEVAGDEGEDEKDAVAKRQRRGALRRSEVAQPDVLERGVYGALGNELETERRARSRRGPPVNLRPTDAVSSTTEAAVAPLPPSALSPSLRCRRPLHTTPSLAPLNRPIYLATDSAHPLTDPAVKRFWDTFPCIFTWEDFVALAKGESSANGEQGVGTGVDLRKELRSVRALKHAVNENDGVDMGRILTPFTEAMIIAKGAATIGTPLSTFSEFARAEMHDVYREELAEKLAKGKKSGWGW